MLIELPVVCETARKDSVSANFLLAKRCYIRQYDGGIANYGSAFPLTSASRTLALASVMQSSSGSAGQTIRAVALPRMLAAIEAGLPRALPDERKRLRRRAYLIREVLSVTNSLVASKKLPPSLSRDEHGPTWD
jgi:hypothetical protein